MNFRCYSYSLPLANTLICFFDNGCFFITFESLCIFVEHLNIWNFPIFHLKWKNASNVDSFGFFSSSHTLFIFSSFNTRNTFICCLYCMYSVISSLCEKNSIDFFFIDKMEHSFKNRFDNTQIWCDNKSIMEFGRLPESFSIRSRGIWKMMKINCTSKSEFPDGISNLFD